MVEETIATLKMLSIDMIQKAGSGHPGIALGAAPILYTLYANHITVNPSDSTWPNRDRFVLSAGHGSALLYATLFLSGFALTIDDLKKFRRIGSKTPGHPEVGVTPGVDVSTGPLGQGFANAVGLAISEKKLRQELTFPQSSRLFEARSLIDHYVYVLCGDGDLMEGITNEAASLAGTLKLSHLIVLYDSNQVSLDGATDQTFTENVRARFEALGWNTEFVKDGSNIEEIDKALHRAKKADAPSLIEIRTILGRGSNWEGTSKIHGKLLEKDDLEQLRYSLGMPKTPFTYSEAVKNDFSKRLIVRSREKYNLWATNYQDFLNGKTGKKADQYQFLWNKESVPNLLQHPIYLDPQLKEATRVTNRRILKEIADLLPSFMGGSADLASSTNVYLDKYADITWADFSGRNLWFGVREHAMGAILNGLALDHWMVFGSTFLAFADYVKPAIRMSALMKLPVTYIFTHDSICVGQDGPTHEPVEQLAMLRSIPDFDVYRPCDAHELIGCWNCILQFRRPTALILSRTEVELNETTRADLVAYGGYTVRKEQGPLQGILIATGTEVGIATHLAYDLEAELGLYLRVVSMPCRELFLKQSSDYQNQILPKGYKKFVIEAGSKSGWEGFVYSNDYLCTIDQFGASGTKEEVLHYCQFDYETLKSRIANRY